MKTLENKCIDCCGTMEKYIQSIFDNLFLLPGARVKNEYFYS